MSAVSETKLTLAAPEDMHAFGVRLGRLLRAGDTVLLHGPLGAGKTTLTRGIGEGLGVRGPVQSPTFVVARTHPSLVGGPQLIHVDAYRLSSADEFEDLDLDFARSVVVVEWAAGMLDPGESWLELTISRPTGEGTDAVGTAAEDADAAGEEPRTVLLEAHGPRWEGVEFGE